MTRSAAYRSNRAAYRVARLVATAFTLMLYESVDRYGFFEADGARRFVSGLLGDDAPREINWSLVAERLNVEYAEAAA